MSVSAAAAWWWRYGRCRRTGGVGGTGGTVARTEDAAFDGEVVGLIGAGAFVAFGDAGEYQGLLPVRRLRGDWWELNDEGTILVGTRNGGSIRLGDPITVRVGRIDAPRGRVDLLPADAGRLGLSYGQR